MGHYALSVCHKYNMLHCLLEAVERGFDNVPNVQSIKNVRTAQAGIILSSKSYTSKDNFPLNPLVMTSFLTN